jgi:SAM-dependent methyltransferase
MPFDTKKIWDACGQAFDRFTTAGDSYSDNIERPAIEQLIGEVNGARVLDVGCGSGTYSAWLAKRGAQVFGVDLSSTMISLAHARARERGVELELSVADISKPLPFGEAEFDTVLTATALHYVENLGSALKEIARAMKAGAQLVASALHPMSTSRFPADLDALDSWDARHGWEARYFGSPTRVIETPWLGFGDVSSEGRRITCYHHTTADYFGAIRSAGLTITDLIEPRPPAGFAAKNPDRYNEAMRVPVYLIFRAVKQPLATNSSGQIALQ